MLTQFKLRSVPWKSLRRSFSNSSYLITDADIEQYKTKGYVLVKNQIGSEKVDYYNQRFKDIVEGL